MTVAGDNPIQSPDDDLLGRTPLATSFANQVLSLDASEGLVVGVLGAWGSGKTSFVNLARRDLADAEVETLEFNPWMFSGAEQLVESFFVELAAQLKLRPGLAEVGQNLEDYGEAFSGLAWLPLVGPWIERGRLANKILSRMLQRRKEGIGGRRAKLESALSELRRPIVVVLDDIDRLSTSEIRDVFKLVRLTASFPNIIYIVAFDRLRVEQALAEQGVPGRDYLEKILQVAIDLPAIPNQVLNRQILTALDEALGEIENPGQLEEQSWPDVFMEIIRPLIRNMRDVRRYAAAARGTVNELGGEIALTDLLALEAVRVFLPDVFARFHAAVEGLTTPSGALGGGDPPQLKEQIDGLKDAAGAHVGVVEAMITRLFPAGQRHISGSFYSGGWAHRWLRERRVAHQDILRFYLERVAGTGLQAFRDAESAWSVMTDRDAFDDFLRSLDPDGLEDVIGSLEAYEDEFGAAHVVPGNIVLLNLLPDLPDRPRGVFDLDARFVVGRVTYRLLRSLDDQSAVEDATRQILPELKSLSSKLELITAIGHRENAGHKLVSEMAATNFEKAWREEVRATSVEGLVQEHDLIRVLLVAKRDTEPSEDKLAIPNSPALTLAILRGARSDARSQSVGTRTVRRSPRLAWDALIDLYGDETTLKESLVKLEDAKPEGNDDLLELADKYAGGWRPDHYGED
jgi:KAP family P-loop domain